MKTVEFKYDIAQKIIIKAISAPGMIDSLMCDSYGNQYHVIYWDNSERHTDWMYEWEIEECAVVEIGVHHGF